MVGYVDSAIVGSQVRIRFDDAFHNGNPDRAEFFYPQCSCTNLSPRAPGPDFPGASANINSQQFYFQAEYAPISRFSVFAEVSFRWIEPQASSFIAGSFTPGVDFPSTATNVGISDVRAGIKLALIDTSNHAFTLQVKAYFPSGSGSLGLGTAHYSFEPPLLYYRRVSERWTIESQIGDWHPIDGCDLDYRKPRDLETIMRFHAESIGCMLCASRGARRNIQTVGDGLREKELSKGISTTSLFVGIAGDLRFLAAATRCHERF